MSSNLHSVGTNKSHQKSSLLYWNRKKNNIKAINKTKVVDSIFMNLIETKALVHSFCLHGCFL